MALTISNAWYEGQADGRLVVLLDIYDGATHWKAISGSVNPDSDLYTTPVALKKASPVAKEYHPITREMTIGEIWCDVTADWLKPILLNNRLKGQQVSVKVGWHNLDESDFVLQFRGVIEDPQPATEQGTIKLIVLDVFTILSTTSLTGGTFIGKHPLEVFYNGSDGVFDRIDIVAAQVDTASYDPTDARYATSISHFNTTGLAPGTTARKITKTRTVYEHTPGTFGGLTAREIKTVTYSAYDHAVINALETVNDLTQIMYGMNRTNDDGKLEFVHFDSARAVADNWTDGDIIPGSFRQTTAEGLVINRITLNFGDNHVLRMEEADSQTAYAQVGSTKRVFEYEVNTNWVNYKSAMLSSLLQADTDLQLYGSIHGFCGNRWPGFPAGAQPASAALNANRPAYLRLSNPHIDEDGAADNNLRAEIASFEANTYLAEVNEKEINLYDPDDGSVSIQVYPAVLEFSSGTRGEFGTDLIGDGINGSYILITDITMLVYCATQIFNRCRYGMGIVEFSTAMDKFGVQEGDLIGLTTNKYLAYNQDGLDGTQKLECVFKEPILFEGEPRIKWRFALAETGSATITAPFVTRGRWLSFIDSLNLRDDQIDVLSKGVISGLAVTDTGGLTGQVGKGIANGSYGRAYLSADRAHTFTANKDTYVRLSVEDQTLSFHRTALGAGTPVLLLGEIEIAKVVTGGAGITSITDNRGELDRPLGGTRIQTETITQNEVEDNALGIAKQKVGEVYTVSVNSDYSHWTKG